MSQNFNEFHSQHAGGLPGGSVQLRGQSPNKALWLVLTISATLLTLVLGIRHIQNHVGLALVYFVAMVVLGGVAYRLHHYTLYVTGDRLILPCRQLHRGNTYAVDYIFQVPNQTVELNQLTVTATVRCMQHSIHHASRTIRSTLSHGASQRRVVNVRKRAQEALYTESIPAQTMGWDQPQVQASFSIHIPKWLPSSGGLGQHPTMQGTVQWVMDVEVKKQRQHHHTSFLLHIAAPKAD